MGASGDGVGARRGSAGLKQVTGRMDGDEVQAIVTPHLLDYRGHAIRVAAVGTIFKRRTVYH